MQQLIVSTFEREYDDKELQQQKSSGSSKLQQKKFSEIQHSRSSVQNNLSIDHAKCKLRFMQFSVLYILFLLICVLRLFFFFIKIMYAAVDAH